MDVTRNTQNSPPARMAGQPRRARAAFAAATLLLSWVMLLVASTAPLQASASGEDFYWKNSYGRGAGVIEQQYCQNPSQHIEAGLCYDNPRPGYNCNGTNTCVADCPVGYSASGMLTCHYNGTALYTPPSHWNSCKYRTPRSCTSWGALGTSCVGGDCIGGLDQDGCRDGYQKIAASCDKSLPAGFTGSAADPMRPTYSRGAGVVPVLRCNQTHPEQDASLCYAPCRAGYKGIGPVCWGEPPPEYMACGPFGFAQSKAKCSGVLSVQAVVVTALAATLGGAAASVLCGPECAAAANEGKNAAILAAKKIVVKNAPAFVAGAQRLLLHGAKVMKPLSDSLVSGAKGMAVGKVDMSKLVATHLFESLVKSSDFLTLDRELKTLMTLGGIADTSIGIYDTANAGSLDPVELALAQVRGVTGAMEVVGSLAQLYNPALASNEALSLANDSFGVISAFAFPIYGQ